MTSEQLARLRADVGEDGDTGEKSFLVRLEDLERVLAERKQLLEACRFALVQRRSMPLNRDEFEEFMLSRIAYAEEAAP